MREAIEAHAQSEENEDEDALIRRLLGVLSRDTLPRLPEHASVGESIQVCRESIFVPVIGATEKQPDRAADEIPAACVEDKNAVTVSDSHDGNQEYTSGAYGTQKQTVLLVDSARRVRYFERTLYDSNANPIPVGKGDRSFEFVMKR